MWSIHLEFAGLFTAFHPAAGFICSLTSHNYWNLKHRDAYIIHAVGLIGTSISSVVLPSSIKCADGEPDLTTLADLLDRWDAAPS
jgi:hypothetical protein